MSICRDVVTDDGEAVALDERADRVYYVPVTGVTIVLGDWYGGKSISFMQLLYEFFVARTAVQLSDV